MRRWKKPKTTMEDDDIYDYRDDMVDDNKFHSLINI